MRSKAFEKASSCGPPRFHFGHRLLERRGRIGFRTLLGEDDARRDARPRAWSCSRDNRLESDLSPDHCLRAAHDGQISRFRTTSVAPHPPRSGGASAKPTTLGCRASSARTASRCTPIPLPWMIRTSRNPASWAASRYDATTSFSVARREGVEVDGVLDRERDVVGQLVVHGGLPRRALLECHFRETRWLNRCFVRP